MIYYTIGIRAWSNEVSEFVNVIAFWKSMDEVLK